MYIYSTRSSAGRYRYGVGTGTENAIGVAFGLRDVRSVDPVLWDCVVPPSVPTQGKSDAGVTPSVGIVVEGTSSD